MIKSVVNKQTAVSRMSSIPTGFFCFGFFKTYCQIFMSCLLSGFSLIRVYLITLSNWWTCRRLSESANIIVKTWNNLFENRKLFDIESNIWKKVMTILKLFISFLRTTRKTKHRVKHEYFSCFTFPYVL